MIKTLSSIIALNFVWAFLIFPAQAQSPARATAEYPDVNSNDWFEPYVTEATDLGLFQGYPDGRFGPWDPTNRAELAKVMIELKNQLQHHWLQENAFEIILVFITLIGWICVIAAIKQMANPSIIVEASKASDPPTKGPNKKTILKIRTKTPRPYYPFNTIANKDTPKSPIPEEKITSKAQVKNQNSNWWA